MRGFKNDKEAIKLWGAAYSAVPKSAFAVVCWHLADLASDDDVAGSPDFRGCDLSGCGLSGVTLPQLWWWSEQGAASTDTPKGGAA